MIEISLTAEHLDCIKQVLFGQQKQANVINDSVVKIVARELAAVVSASNITSIDEADDAILQYLRGVVAGELQYDEDAFILIAGEVSLANAKSGMPVTVTAEAASETSTKVNYRVSVMGEEAAEVDMSAEAGKPASAMPDLPISGEVKKTQVSDFRTKAEQLRAAILPLVPDAVKQELAGDEYAQCLVCAEQYFAYRS